jgi:hypothetical protein
MLAYNMPTWFQQSFKAKVLDKKFSLTPFLKNGLLEADFNGNKFNDIAVLVTERKTKNKGLLLLHQQDSYFVFGAGTKIGSGSDNFNWAKGFLYNLVSMVIKIIAIHWPA